MSGREHLLQLYNHVRRSTDQSRQNNNGNACDPSREETRGRSAQWGQGEVLCVG